MKYKKAVKIIFFIILFTDFDGNSRIIYVNTIFLSQQKRTKI